MMSSSRSKGGLEVSKASDMSDVDDDPKRTGAEDVDDGPNEATLLVLAKRCLYWYVGSMPYISSKTDLAAGMGKLASLYQEDFCWATCYQPDFVAELMYRGFLPMAIKESGVEVLLPKLHVKRFLVMFADISKAHGSTMKKAKKFDLTADTCFAEVAAGIVEQHGENWFYPRLVKTFTRMNKGNQKGLFKGKVRIHSFELWKDGELVAGECGYSCGKVYTSLSGFTRMDGAGTVQMYAMVAHLKSLGFVVWDLGMLLAYKEREFGGKEYPRMEFLEIIAKHRDEPIAGQVHLEDRTNAKTLLSNMSGGSGPKDDEMENGEDKKASEATSSALQTQSQN